MHGLTGALHFIGGVPEMIVPDCPKALVTNADRYEPLINRVAQDWSSVKSSGATTGAWSGYCVKPN